MKVIHFSTNNSVGINLSVEEKENGDLLFIRVFQTASPKKTKPPELFALRAEEKHAVMEYLNEGHALAPASDAKEE